MKMGKTKIYTFLVFLLLSFGSMAFVTWIAKLAYINTSVELQEQQIGSEIAGQVNFMENAINFGKELDNYYGIEEQLESITNVREGILSALILDTEGEVLYSSSNFEDNDTNVAILEEIYGGKYQQKMISVTDAEGNGEIIELTDERSMVFPIRKNAESIVGYLAVLYNKDDLLEDFSDERISGALVIIWFVTNVFLGLFIFTQDIASPKWYVRYLPTIMIMAGMLIFIFFLYNIYQEQYRIMIRENAELTSQSVQESVNNLIEKGLPAENAGMVGNYINGKVEGNESIASISIAKGIYDTSEFIENTDSDIIRFPLSDGKTSMNIVVNEGFITQLIYEMKLTFGAIFVICLMITYELTHMVEIITARIKEDFGEDTPEQAKGIGAQIKLISFLSYTAIYTSMPYAAVIMRGWDARVFGLSASLSASLPLTVELLCIMLFSVLIQKVFADSKLKNLIFFAFPLLMIGNLACMRVDSPYVLIGLRAFCGIGFAFLKYWLNAYVAAGSSDSKEVKANFALLNAGLLGGITVGASLGSLLAQSFGYQYNYTFTAIVCVLIMIFAIIFVPWRMIDQRRAKAIVSSEANKVRFAELIKKPAVLKAIILGDVPLNIGLMYVVAFLPVYMASIGQSSIITSYAYLLNGLAGVYVGVFLVRVLRKLSPKMASSLSLLTGAFGILILVGGQNAAIVLASAAVMGLFDGYGTPTITGFFTALPEVESADTAGMLTVYSSVGSAVQIICPMLYNVLIQPDGKTTYLLIFGIMFAIVGMIFPLMFKGQQTVKNKV